MAVSYSILNYRMRKSERKWFLKKCAGEFGGWYLFCISCVRVEIWSRGEGEQGNSGTSSCTDLWKHPPRSHSTLMSLGRRRGMGIYNQDFRVHKTQMRTHAPTPTQGKDNVTLCLSHTRETWAVRLQLHIVDVNAFKTLMSLREY